MDICEGSPFWTGQELTSESPLFTACFQTTVLEWIPFIWLFTSVPCYVFYLTKQDTGTPLPITSFSVVKSFVCALLCILTLMQIWTADNYGYNCIHEVAAPTSFYIGIAFRAFSFALLALFIQLVRHRGVISAAIFTIYWILLILCSVIPLQNCISYHPNCEGCILYYVYVALVIIEFVLHCFADKRSSLNYQQIGKPACPEKDASSLSLYSFMWFTGTVLTAYKRKLGPGDLWEQTNRLKCENTVAEVNRHWDEQIIHIEKEKKLHEIKIRRQNSSVKDDTPLIGKKEKFDFEFQQSSTKTKKPSLFMSLIKAYWLIFLAGSFVKIACDCLILTQPLLLKLIIGFIESKGTGEHPSWYGYALSSLFFFAGFNELFLFHQAAHIMMTLGLRVKTSLIGLIYRKSLRLSNAAKKNYTVGEIVNLMSVDCQRIQDSFQFSYYIITFFVVMAIGMWEIWDAVGISMLGALLAVVVFGVMNVFFGKLQERYQRGLLRLKGKRIKVVNEVLGGIKVLKMYGWEPTFKQKILDIRDQEMHFLKKIAIVSACSILCAVHSPFFLTWAAFMIYILKDTTVFLDPQSLFLVLSVLNIIRFPVALVPFVITGIIQSYVSVGRIQNFLWQEELDSDNVQFDDTAEDAISIDHGRFTWDIDRPFPTLSNINLSIPDGGLVAIVGPVGAGKSSIISAMLGEMDKRQGVVTVKGSIAYVPQEAWIQNMTLRDNVLYGKPYRERKYNKILEACCLLPDLEILSAGDQTEIGMRGVNISGGQKQRVSLARSVYNNADIYLLDDPLSAVDSHVGKAIFKNIIGKEGLLRHKTRVLVTHGVHWLPDVDKIIVMNNGQITETGSYEELIQHNGPFAQFLHEYLLKNDESEDEENDPEIQIIKTKIRERVENVTSDGLTSDDNIFDSSAHSRRKRKTGSRKRTVSTLSGNEVVYTTRASSVSSYGRSVSQLEEKVQTTVGQLIQQEELAEGAVKFAVVKRLVKSMGFMSALFSFILLSAYQATNVYSNFYLTDWSVDEYLSNTSLKSTPEYSDKNVFYLGMYSLQGFIQGILLLAFSILSLLRIVVATGRIHKSMLHCILRSPMAFFDTTPIGRIMNRFSSDIDLIDDRFPRTFRLWSIMIMTLASTVIVISIQTPVFAIAMIPVGIIYVFLLRLYLPTARQVKRVESVTRSPVYNHFTETVIGASVIRAYRSQDRFIQESQKRVDVNCMFFYAANTSGRWISTVVESLSNLLVFAAALFSITSDDLAGADAGLSLTYALQIVYALNLVGQSVSEMEMNIVSAERILEYTDLEPEADWVVPAFRPNPSWPETGQIKFLNYTTRYRPELDLVLKGINCTIQSGEKLGIVGRTGAGKSSLTLSLFRLIESAGGSIVIDGIRISDIGLHDLRPRITILPQDPVLFSGSLKSNLDPLDKFNEADIWRALESAHLKGYIKEQREGLEYECGEGGQNFSVGQRQLVCLGRSLLHKNKILILDEATAAVDMETDELIQQTIKSDFADCTVVTIAHRLNTIMDYDRVVVMDQGNIAECDTPRNLLEDPKSIFHGMAKDADILNWFDKSG